MVSTEAFRSHLVSALRWSIGVGIFCILCSPLIRPDGFFFPFIVPRYLWFRILVELVFFSWLALLILDPTVRFVRDRVVLGWLAFVAVATLSSIFGLGFFRSFWSNYERMGGLLQLYHITALLVVLRSVVKTERTWEMLLQSAAGMGVVTAAIGWLQYFHASFVPPSLTEPRVSALLGNPAYLGAMLAFVVFFLLYYFLFPQRAYARWWGGFGLLLGVGLLLANAWVAPLDPVGPAGWLYQIWVFGALWVFPVALIASAGLVLWRGSELRYVLIEMGLLLGFVGAVLIQTQTRGALLGVWGGVAVVLGGLAWWAHPTGETRTIGRIGLVAWIGLPILVWGAAQSPLAESFTLLQRLGSISLGDITTQSRLLVWPASVEGWLSSPHSIFLGFGVEQYQPVFNAHFPVEIFRDRGSQIWFDRAHNQILDTLVATGVLGFLCLGYFFLQLGRQAFAVVARNRLFGPSVILGGAVIAYLIQNQFIFDTLNTDVPLLVAVAGLGFLAAGQVEREPKRGLPPHWQWVGVVGLVALMLVCMSVFNVRTAVANKQLYRGLVLSQRSFSQEAVDLIRSSLGTGWVGRWEAREQYANLAQRLLAGRHQASAAVARDVIAQLRRSIAEEPSNVRHYLILADVYNTLEVLQPGSSLSALEVLADAKPLSPARPHLYFSEGRAYAQIGKTAEAIASFRYGVALAPWVIDSHLRILTLYILVGDKDSATAELLAAMALRNGALLPDEVEQIRNTLRQSKRFDWMVEWFTPLVDASAPPYYALTLAEGWLGQGKFAEADAILNPVLERVPTLAETVEALRAQYQPSAEDTE